MNELHLFAGAGGGILGGELLGHTTVCAVEIEPYPRKVLLQRQRDGILPRFPIWDDITTFDGNPWRGRVDVVCGGFPCQDISAAGKGAGITGARSGLWGEMARVIREVRPRYAFIENSPRLTIRGLDRVLCDLAKMGYNARWGVFSAADVGAPNVRERVWILADTEKSIRNGAVRPEGDKGYRNGANISRKWNDARSVFGSDYLDFISPRTARRESQSDLCLVVDGMAEQVEQLAALGNGQVPQVAALAWKILTGKESKT